MKKPANDYIISDEQLSGAIRLKKYLLLTLGTVSLVLGAAGLFLPLLPTTPFLLLSAACYMRSSKRLYRWITGNRIFGTYISNYMQYRAITLKSKIATLVLLWAVIIISVVAAKILWIRILLAAVAVGVTIHISRIRTL